MSDAIHAVATRHPLDYDRLRKGDYIDPGKIEQITGINRADYKAYSFAALGVKTQLEQEMARRGTPVFTKMEGDGIRLLKDDEAVIYADKRHREMSRGLIRNNVRSVAAIDVRMLDADQRRRHERDVIARSRELQAMKDTRKQLSQAEKRKELPPS